MCSIPIYDRTVRTDGPAGRLVVRVTDPATMAADVVAGWREARLTAPTAGEAAATIFRHLYGRSAGRGGELVCKARGWWKPYGRHRRFVFAFREIGPSEFPGLSLWSVWPVGKVVEWTWNPETAAD